MRYPTYFDALAKELLKNLLVGDLSKRYGNLRAGSSDIFAHGWFAEVDWDKLYRREIPAPYVPKIAGEGDASQSVGVDAIAGRVLMSGSTGTRRPMSASTARTVRDLMTTSSRNFSCLRFIGKAHGPRRAEMPGERGPGKIADEGKGQGESYQSVCGVPQCLDASVCTSLGSWVVMPIICRHLW